MVFGRFFEGMMGGPKPEKPVKRDYDAEVQETFAQTGKARLDHLNRPEVKASSASTVEKSYISPAAESPYEGARRAEPVRMTPPAYKLESVEISEETEREFAANSNESKEKSA